jgi:hypothetical protein
MRRRRPCWSCGRPTQLVELVEADLDAGPTSRPAWWQSVGRVIWLCPTALLCAGRPIPTPRKEVTLP